MVRMVVIAAIAAAIMISSTVALGDPGGDKGGGVCPPPAAIERVAKWNESVARLYQRWMAFCEHWPGSTPSPTPTPAPTPVPGPVADVMITGLSVTAPSTGAPGVPFSVRGGATMRNTGPELSIMVDLTFNFTAPVDCTITPALQVTVEDTNLPLNVNAFVSRSWTATCSQAGPHMFNVAAVAVLDPAQGATDPNMANNSASNSATTQVN